MRLRQVALVASELDPVERQLREVLGLELCFRDPGVGRFGLHNGLFPVGDAFIEVVAPVRDDTTAGRLLERRGGDGGYMVLVQVDDLAPVEKRVAELGVRTIYEAHGEGIRGVHLHPKDVGGAIVSVDVAEPPSSWGWAGPSWRDHVRTDVVTALAGVVVQVTDPDTVAARWAAVLDRPLTGSGRVLAMDDGATIEMVPPGDDRGDGVAGLRLRAADPARVGERFELGGVWIELTV
ncbi:MAG: VOC family protein [Actinomycetota bacterium]|nr:VOC family protein [Actinomycetota bacterium]